MGRQFRLRCQNVYVLCSTVTIRQVELATHLNNRFYRLLEELLNFYLYIKDVSTQ